MNIFEKNHETEFHFMVDIETLAVSNNAAITEIGAVSMHSDTSFHCECWDDYGDRDPKTIQWRLDNNLYWVSEHSDPVSIALYRFFEWVNACAGGREPILWCKGTDFDAVIISNAAKRHHFELPWKYNAIRDVRTLLQFFPQFKVPKELVKHNGLADAIMQKEYLLKIANHIQDCEEDAGIGHG